MPSTSVGVIFYYYRFLYFSSFPEANFNAIPITRHTTAKPNIQ